MSEITDIPNIDNHLFNIDERRNKFIPCWFFTCERDDAERILQDCFDTESGSVLMRASLQSDGKKWKYVISAYSRKKQVILHYKILQKFDKSLKLDIDQKHPPLASLTQAMDCFLELADSKKIKLTPVNLSRPVNLTNSMKSRDYVPPGKSGTENDLGIYIDTQRLTLSTEPAGFVGGVQPISSDYLTIQDELSAEDTPLGYANQAAPFADYKNILPNGIQVIQTLNPVASSTSDYLPPARRDSCDKVLGECRSPPISPTFLTNRPNLPRKSSSSTLSSSSSQNSLKNSCIASSGKETVQQLEVSTPAYDVPRRCRKTGWKKVSTSSVEECRSTDKKIANNEKLDEKDADKRNALDKKVADQEAIDKDTLYDVPINYKSLAKKIEYDKSHPDSADRQVSPVACQKTTTSSDIISERL